MTRREATPSRSRRQPPGASAVVETVAQRDHQARIETRDHGRETMQRGAETYRAVQLSEAHALYTMHPEKDADNAPR